MEDSGLMAEKKSYIFYYDYIDTILSELTYEEIGQLVDAIITYERYGIDTEFEDRTVKTAYKRMCADSDRNVQEYRKTCQIQREKALKRWHKENEEEQ